MSVPLEPARERFGLLACGSAGPWDVDVDESLDQEGCWFVDLRGPKTFFTFQVSDLGVIPLVVAFLEKQRPDRGRPRSPADRAADRCLMVGRFGAAAVSLQWDAEFEDRCFLVIQAEGTPALRWTFDGEDLSSLLAALKQVAQDLSDAVA